MRKHPLEKKRLFRLTILAVIFTLIGSTASAYQFYDVRSQLLSGLSKSDISTSGRRLALVYHVEDKEQVKASHNLVALKKDLSHELLKSFDVVDPIIVNEILTINSLSYEQLLTDSSVLKQFSERSDADQILFVNLSPLDQDTILARFKLMTTDSNQITGLETPIASSTSSPVSQPSFQTASVANQVAGETDSVLQSFISDFVPKSFLSGQNDAWIFFRPTALIIPETHAIETQVWVRNLAEVDIRMLRLRYDLKLVDMFQVGAQLYATTPSNNTSDGIHSLYISGKYQLNDQFTLPIALTLGIRKRILFNSDNLDYTKGDSGTNAKNDAYNATTFQAMGTGKLENIGLLYNFYLDSTTLSAGAKFLITPELKVFIDEILYHHPDPLISSDTAFGVQLYNVSGYASLSYQVSSSQLLLGFNFDF